MAVFDMFADRQYLNLETLRRSGEPVCTPVWFVQDGDVLMIRTLADSGKVRRIRRNGAVRIAPCKADGRLDGPWIPARAAEIADDRTVRSADRQLDRKYGFLNEMFSLVARIRHQKQTILRIDPINP